MHYLAVDLLNSAFFHFYRNDDKEQLCSYFLSNLLKLKKQLKADKILLLQEGGTSAYRTSILPEYKQARYERRKSLPQKDKDKFANDLKNLQEFCGYAELLGMECIRVAGAEADDLAGFIATKCEYDKLTFLSSDKDWYQLISPKVQIGKYDRTLVEAINQHILKGIFLTEETFLSQYGIYPSAYLEVKMLAGDPSDSIKGVPKIGEVLALRYIKEYGRIAKLIAHAPYWSCAVIANKHKNPPVPFRIPHSSLDFLTTEECTTLMKRNHKLMCLTGESLDATLDKDSQNYIKEILSRPEKIDEVALQELKWEKGWLAFD